MQIDTTSYTNKDFRSIWPELLDLVTDLTDKWDPNNSNESDVGVALLKLKAFIADKLNYNIDKNTLEAFPSAVTQRGNAQKLYDTLGYELQWYKSASTDVIFKFINPADSKIDLDTVTVEFTIPKFTQLTNSDNTLVYTTLKDTKLDTYNNTQTDAEFAVEAMEGPVETFLINGSDIITINNLDADYRLYFTESMIASNGIFINNIGIDEFWQNTFNLESTQLGQKVFKFGVLPNTNQCYIEFPQDAAELFGEGINIHYLISSGTKGNMKKNILTTFAQEYPNAGVGNDGTHYSLSTYVRVTNPNATNNGQDPESLDSAYENYQKTVNTFSTLVTLIDYFNAIYRENAISNCVVTDRSTDFNYSYKVKSKSLMGEEDIFLAPPNKKMNAFNLCVYVLNKVSSVYDKKSYDRSFETNSTSEKNAIESIENYKSIQHDWISQFNPDTSNLTYLFKNAITISGQIITYSKVSTVEASDIIENIQTALYNQYQSRNISFGQNLDYSAVRQVILDADTRVKEVILNDFQYDIGSMSTDNVWISLNNTSGISFSNTMSALCLDIIAKSILTGVTPLFIFDDVITYSYQMANVGKYIDGTSGNLASNQYAYNSTAESIELAETPNPNMAATGQEPQALDEPYRNISAITTQATITLPKAQSFTDASGNPSIRLNPYTLQTNETVFFYRPSYISTAQIGTYLYVALCVNHITYAEDEVRTIKANELYQLKDDEYLVYYESKDTFTVDGQNISGIPINENYRGTSQTSKKLKVIPAGTIIKPSFTMTTSGNSCLNFFPPQTDVDGRMFLPNYVNLESDKTIDIMDSNATKINAKNPGNPADNTTKTIYCTWITDDIDNRLFNDLDQKNAYDAKIASALGDKVYIEHILQNNEVFIYTDASKSDIIICQSGTKVKMPYLSNIDWNSAWSIETPDLTEINNEGINNTMELKEIPRNVEFFEVEELQIETLGAGVSITNSGTADFIIKNTETIVNNPSDISWVAPNSDDVINLPNISLNGSDDTNKWKVFSRLSVFSTPETVFTLYKHTQGTAKSVQSIGLFRKTIDAETGDEQYTLAGVLGPGQSFSTNYPLVTAGGIKQNVEVLKKEDESLEPLTFVAYKYTPMVTDNAQSLWTTSGLSASDTLDVNLLSGNVYQTKLHIGANSSTTSVALTLNLSSLFDAEPNQNYGTIIPIIITANDYTNISTSISGLNLIGYSQIPTKFKYGELLCYNYVSGNTFTITLSNLSPDMTISINMYQPQKVISINQFENPFSTSQFYSDSDILNKIAGMATNTDGVNKFDYSYAVPEDMLIENPLDPLSFYENQHVCNNITISQIDNINISVARQSKL